MSGAALRLPLAEARAKAEELVALLAPACERIEIAGSIRRGRADVGDLEVVCQPRLAETRDMFGAVISEDPWLFDALCAALFGEGRFKHRPNKNGWPAYGERYKRLLFDGLPLDLFSVLPPAQFGVLYLIRTGSAAFAQRLVTPVEQGGWMPAGMWCRDGVLWRNGAALETPEETDVFRVIGREWIEPGERA